jgi:hypothetical protein
MHLLTPSCGPSQEVSCLVYWVEKASDPILQVREMVPLIQLLQDSMKLVAVKHPFNLPQKLVCISLPLLISRLILLQVPGSKNTLYSSWLTPIRLSPPFSKGLDLKSTI